MPLTLRTKILAAYGLLFTFFLAILLTGFSQLRQIASRLDLIQLGYLPISKTVNSLNNFFHLDDSFDVRKIIENQGNRMFLDSIATTSPKLLKQGFEKGVNDARAALRTSPSPQLEQSLDRVSAPMNDLLAEHNAYTALINTVLKNVRAKHFDQALAYNEPLIQQKRIVRSHIDRLSRRLDELVREGIQDTVNEERYAVFLILGLSIVTLVLAIFIGRMAIVSLRPLGKLKQTAREIGAGDFSKRVNIHTRDEVGELAGEFNRMADSIQQRDEALQKQQEQLLQSEKMAVIGRLSSKISHEVRNPLNALSLNVELLEEEVRTAEAQKTLKAMATEIDRLNRVAENYLNLARSPKGTAENADLTKLISHLETLIKPECEKHGISVQVETAAPLPTLKLDPGRLEQALLNLARNAMEALPSGGKLGIKTTRENGHVTITVSDSGAGISPEVLPHIFKPFYTTKEKGTGLGLAITSEIIRDQGGTIECESNLGEGSTFIIKIPTAKSA